MIEGQKVICVDDAAPYWLRSHYTTWIKKDTVYVIRGVFLGKNMHGQAGEVGVYLLGINNPHHTQPPYPELGYNAERFRALGELPPEKRQAETPIEEEVLV